MASIRTEFLIGVDAAGVWQVIGDWADGPVRMARGLVVSSHLEGTDRVVTFANGIISRERLVTRDDEARRIVYSIVGDTVRPEHDNAVMQIVPDGTDRCRFIWTRDSCPTSSPVRFARAWNRPARSSSARSRRMRRGEQLVHRHLRRTQPGRIAGDAGQQQRALDQGDHG